MTMLGVVLWARFTLACRCGRDSEIPTMRYQNIIFHLRRARLRWYLCSDYFPTSISPMEIEMIEI